MELRQGKKYILYINYSIIGKRKVPLNYVNTLKLITNFNAVLLLNVLPSSDRKFFHLFEQCSPVFQRKE